ARVDGEWAIVRTGYKAFAACGWTHAAISAALALRPQCPVEEITGIEVRLSPQQLATCAVPGPGTAPGTAARWSVPTTVALTFLGDDMTMPDTFTDARACDAEVFALAARARVVSDASLGAHEACVVVTTRDGGQQHAGAEFGAEASAADNEALVTTK